MLTKPIAYVVSAVVGLALPALCHADNMYDPASGKLVLPVVQVDATRTFFTSFSRVSINPLVFAVDTITETTITETTGNSRSAAVYTAATAAVWVPEVSVDGRLYQLGLRLTNNCTASICLEPRLDSLVALGRSGGEIFTKPVSSSSTYSCASCHAINESQGFATDGIRRPGHPLQNATRRPDYKNGSLKSMLEAVNSCLTEWMNTTPWKTTDRDWINLFNWLDDQATATSVSPVNFDIVAPPAVLPAGNSANGHALFNTRCIVCHGADGVGTPLAPRVTGTGLQAAYTARRIRTSGRSNSAVYAGLTGGIMPFWSADRLSDTELADITAYLVAGDVAPVSTGGNSSAIPSGCTSNSPKLKQTATLSQRFHGVAGKVTLIDDCTIELSGFNYDGGGIDVRLYGGRNLQFHPGQGGIALSDNLLGTRYDNATLRITLPANVSLADFDSISVWCVAVGVSFGDGKFSPLQ